MTPWLLPVEMLGAVTLVSRPTIGVVWLTSCIVGGRGTIAYLAYTHGRTAPGTHDYLRKPS